MAARSGLLPLAVLATVAVALAPWGGNASGPSEASGARLAAGPAGGSFAFANTAAGSAILSARDFRPGSSTDGSVTITNVGTLPGAVTLSQSELVDTPGPNGGLLTGRLDLLVRDVTASEAPVTVYSGKLASMPALPLGTFAPAEARTYSFTASFPEGGIPSSDTGGDNAFTGSSASVSYVWNATGDSPEQMPAGPARDPGPRLRLWFPNRQRTLRRRRLVFFARCNEPCTLKGYARLPAGRRRQALRRGIPARRLVAHRRSRVALPLPQRTLTVLSRSLRRNALTRLRLTMVARDRAGNATVEKRRITLRPIPRTRFWRLSPGS